MPPDSESTITVPGFASKDTGEQPERSTSQGEGRVKYEAVQ